MAGSLTKFPAYGRLPREISNMIWQEALPGPRLIVVRFVQDGRKNVFRFDSDMSSLLHACHDSRVEFLRHYKRAFVHPKARNGVYFNFELDTLLLSDASSWGQQKHFVCHERVKVDISKVQKLAWARHHFTGSKLKTPEYIFQFHNLKELILFGQEVYCLTFELEEMPFAPFSLFARRRIPRPARSVWQLDQAIQRFMADLDDPNEYIQAKDRNAWKLPEIVVDDHEIYLDLCETSYIQDDDQAGETQKGAQSTPTI